MLRLETFHSDIPKIEEFTQNFLDEKVKNSRNRQGEVSADFHQDLLVLALKNVTYLGLNIDLDFEHKGKNYNFSTTFVDFLYF